MDDEMTTEAAAAIMMMLMAAETSSTTADIESMAEWDGMENGCRVMPPSRLKTSNSIIFIPLMNAAHLDFLASRYKVLRVDLCPASIM